MNIQNLQGHLLAAHPKIPTPALKKSVVLILEHAADGAWGVVINRLFARPLAFDDVMEDLGFPSDYSTTYVGLGGPRTASRINILHSLDWSSSTTIKINENLGCSADISILAALSRNQGPEYFLPIAGHLSWNPGQLEGEISGQSPWLPQHEWSIIPATNEMVFEHTSLTMWESVIERANMARIETWFA